MKILLIPILFICFNSFAVEEMTGSWRFLEAIENPNPEYGNQPFPESILIELTGENEGTLTVKLPAQSKPKTYSFSNTVLKNPKTVQTYYEHKENPYSHNEEAITSYSAGTLTVQLTWTSITNPEKIPRESSYHFTLDETGFLLFIRNNNDGVQFKARYSLQE